MRRGEASGGEAGRARRRGRERGVADGGTGREGGREKIGGGVAGDDIKKHSERGRRC